VRLIFETSTRIRFKLRLENPLRFVKTNRKRLPQQQEKRKSDKNLVHKI